MTSPPSLRDLYNDPYSAWSFVPPAPPPTSSAPAVQPSSYQWSTRPSHNSIFDLSPSLDLSEPSGIDVSLLFRSLVASVVLQYTSNAIIMPWEVAKLLLQVQWVPRDAGEPEPSPEPVEEEDEDLSDDSIENDSYFADPSAVHARYPAPQPADEQGYVIRRSVLEEGTRPEYIIPVGSADGVWGMIKRVGRFRGEGWLALWKGLLTSCASEVLSSAIQPLIQNALQSLFLPSMSPFHQPPVLLPFASHVLTGLLLSPLDLVRTRLIVQSFHPRHRTYSGPLDALTQILRNEGGLRGIYLHPHLLIPALIDSALSPAVALALPGLLGARLGARADTTHPVVWALIELAASAVGLLVTLPFETVRRRLQAQVRGGPPLRGCVELRPAPYNGVVDTLWHVLTEERSDLPIAPRRRKGKGKESTAAAQDAEVEAEADESESWLRYTGIGQLYRGLGMRLSGSLIVFLLASLSGGEPDNVGWAEL